MIANKVRLWQIYFTFFKMGAITFGGGYAMLPILQNEVVAKKRWVTEVDLLNYYSIGQCTPGIIAVNAASFIGYKLRGLSGLVSATLGLMTPSIGLVLLVAMVLRQYMDSPYLQWAFGGIRIGVLALIVNTVINMWRGSVRYWRDYAVFIGAALLLFVGRLPAVGVVIVAAIVAFIPNFSRRKRL